MAEKYRILHALDTGLRMQIMDALNDLDARVDAVDARVDGIVTFLQLAPNILAFGVGVNPTWDIVNGNIPLVSAGTDGLNPPTIVGDTIIINSAGVYDINASFGVDIVSSNNTVVIEIEVNGTPEGISAGVEFSGGQAAPISQPQTRDVSILAAGDVITFVALELGTSTKLLLWELSGGTVTQIAHDWGSFAP
jgi:hypothetical protein